MERLNVQIIDSAREENGIAVYSSDRSEPGRIGLSAGDGPGASYEPILDLGSSDWPPEYLFVVGIELEPGHEEDFEDWYNIEHLPALAQVPGVNRAVRYRRSGQDESYPTYLALYDITSPDIAGNADWVQAVETPWTNRLRPHFQACWRGGYRLNR